MFSRSEILKNAISPYQDYCDGYGNPGATGGGYLTTFVLGVATVPVQFSHPGSRVLDEINAFDLAEVESANLGQINMVNVSSFCGPQGLIWGYDIAAHKRLRSHPLAISARNIENGMVPVYSIGALLEAAQRLFGRVSAPRFPFKPGAHVPTAGKNFKFEGPKHIYSAIGVGIPKERDKAAVLFMEDMGWIPAANHDDTHRIEEYKTVVSENLVRSILSVGNNQGVCYKEIFVGLKCVWVNPGEIGCALVAAPYFTIARNAIPQAEPEKLVNLSLDEWLEHFL